MGARCRHGSLFINAGDGVSSIKPYALFASDKCHAVPFNAMPFLPRISVAAALGSEAFDEALDAWLSPAQGRSVKQELEKLARKPGSSYSKSGAVGGSRQRWSMRTASGDNNQPPWRAVPARAGMN